MALIPAKKSFNFAVASVPARDTPIQRYYVIFVSYSEV